MQRASWLQESPRRPGLLQMLVDPNYLERSTALAMTLPCKVGLAMDLLKQIVVDIIRLVDLMPFNIS